MSIPLSQLVTISGSEDCDFSQLNAIAERIPSLIISPLAFSQQTKSHANGSASFQYGLYLQNDRLELHSFKNKKQMPLCIDFLAGKTRHRRIYGGGKGQCISKAMGIKKIPDIKVLDATAGLGGDAFVLASLGCHVTLLERNPVIYSLLKNALDRAQNSDDQVVKNICSRMVLINQNASLYLSTQQKIDYADVIYLDPMFPSRKKSAKVKKEMVYFHDIVGEDSDSDALLDLALKRAHKRIVVKRPRLAEALAGLKAHFSITGKSTRYDVYLP
ncbi:MAG: class I SAM-dependent methyltransferase [Cocleimonas sp.]|nr:class I SAM-dependent methyltransferase [Cocleimonas sp.]